MKKLILLCCIAAKSACYAHAQTRALEAQSAIVMHHEVTIKGKKVPYTPTAGTQPVLN